MKIRRRWRDWVGFHLVLHGAVLVGMIFVVFGWLCGVYRATGEEDGLTDGDLVLYVRVLRNFLPDDEVLYQSKERVGMAKVSTTPDGQIFGRVIARLQVRGFSHDIETDR